MLRSMTGYGRANMVVSGYDITVELKSVNHRYLDVSVRYPRAYGFMEDKLKKLVGEYTTRGKVEVFVVIEKDSGSGSEVTVDKGLLESYLNALRFIQKEYSLTDDISIASVAQYRDIFNQKKEQEDDETIWNSVRDVANKALKSYCAMRDAEGDKLCSNIKEKLSYISQRCAEIEALTPRAVEVYRQRMSEKISEVLGGELQIDQGRLLTEIAIFADKIATDEETTRISSHIDQFYTIMSSNESAGRKLDFLTQELNREVNTIGSKVNDIEISRIVVDLKSELEKIREQIQNVE